MCSRFFYLLIYFRGREGGREREWEHMSRGRGRGEAGESNTWPHPDGASTTPAETKSRHSMD